MKNYEFEGTIVQKSAPVAVSDKLTVQDVVISRSEGLYENTVKFQLTNERIKTYEKIRVNSTVRAEFIIMGKEKDGKFFNNLNLLSLTVI